VTEHDLAQPRRRVAPVLGSEHRLDRFAAHRGATSFVAQQRTPATSSGLDAATVQSQHERSGPGDHDHPGTSACAAEERNESVARHPDTGRGQQGLQHAHDLPFFGFASCARGADSERRDVVRREARAGEEPLDHLSIRTQRNLAPC